VQQVDKRVIDLSSIFILMDEEEEEEEKMRVD
jgi:hypothetical protein